MSAADVQAKLDAATTALSKTTNTYPAMVKKYGSDWKSWPTGTQWYIAESNIAAARAQVAGMVTPAAPSAGFTWKEMSS